VWKGWIVGFAGVWAFISPFFHFAYMGNAWSDWIVGVVAAVFGFAMMSEHPADSWISGIAAVWMFVAGFIPALLMAPGVWWNNLIVGVILAIFGFAGTRATQHMTPTGAHAQ
jgi:uncharacterized membrane protein YuzA (DUF378 family)